MEDRGSDRIDLAGYLQKWNLFDPKPLAITATSDLYKVTWNDQPAVLKLLSSIGISDERNGSLALQCFNGDGSVRLLCCDDQAQLVEYAEGENLKSLVQRGDDKKATEIIGDVLNNLHKAHNPDAAKELTPVKSRFRSLFRTAQEDIRAGVPSLFTEAAELAEKLLADEQDACILHGDMHHENVIHSSKRGWLAIDPKGLHGERAYDCANVLFNPSGMDDLVIDESRLLKTAELLAQALRIELERILSYAFIHACLSASWSLEDQQDPARELSIAVLISAHLPALAR